MKILISSTYFWPYRSGLSEYAYRLGKGLVERGHEVRVLCSQHDPQLGLEEERDGMRITRVPVGIRLSKGVIMPRLKAIAKPLVDWADVVNPHLPQFESPVIARLAQALGKKILVTYHCDLDPKTGWFQQFASKVAMAQGEKTLAMADVIVQNSLDYAQTSPVLKKYLNKVQAIAVPVDLAPADPQEAASFRARFGLLPTDKLIGLAGRVASEKGFETLIAALPRVLDAVPTARVVHAGAWKGVVGEQGYQKKIETALQAWPEKWKNLGFLSDDDFRAFFKAIDVLAFTSHTRTESYGIVQIEALAQGTPIVATAMPGMRQPVLQTGRGALFAKQNSQELAEKLVTLLQVEPEKVVPQTFLEQFSYQAVSKKYEELF